MEKFDELVSYSMTDDEMLVATHYNEYQQANLQNKLSATYKKLAELTCNPSDIHGFIQEEAELQGRLRLLQELLAEHSDLRSLMQEVDN